MPMRIISQGRHAYLLAGYLLKRGKWSFQWSERYFVLTQTALHYFKRDRRELYGKERGAFLLADMTLTLHPEKLCLEIHGKSSGITRMLKAPNEREYLTWSKVLSDALARVNGEAVSSGHHGNGVTLDALHTVAALRQPLGAAPLEGSHSASYTGNYSNRPSVQGTPTGLAHHQLFQNPGSAATSPMQPNTKPQSMRNLLSASNSAAALTNITPAKGGKDVPTLSRFPSSPASQSPLDALLDKDATPLLKAPLVPNLLPLPIPEVPSGYSTGMSASPMPSPKADERQAQVPHTYAKAAAASTTSPLKSRTSSIGQKDKLPKNTKSGGGFHHPDEQVDVLRKYSMQDSPSPPALMGLNSPLSPARSSSPMLAGMSINIGREHIAMITLEGNMLKNLGNIAPAPVEAPTGGSNPAVSSQPLRLLASSDLPWNQSVSVNGFCPGSLVRAILADGSSVSLEYEAVAKEIQAGLKEGNKLLALHTANQLDLKRQVLVSWKYESLAAPALEPPTTSFLCMEVAKASSSAAAKKHKQRQILLPALYCLAFVPWLCAQNSATSFFSFLLCTFGLVMAIDSLARAATEPSASSPATASTAATPAPSSSNADNRQRWEFCFVSLLDQTGANDTHNISPSQSLAHSSSSRKKKGILRRRANDLPSVSPGAVAAIAVANATDKMLLSAEPLYAHSRHAGRDFELSEYSDFDSGRDTRESSQIGHKRDLKHFREASGTSVEMDSRVVSSGADEEVDSPANAPVKRLAANVSASEMPRELRAQAMDLSAAASTSAPSDASSSASVSRAPSTSTVDASASGTQLPFDRQGSTRSDGGDSEHHDEAFQTDAESQNHGNMSDFEGDADHSALEADEAELTKQIMESLNHYEDSPVLLRPEHMPEPIPAPWGSWSEDDTSKLNVRGPTFLQDKIKIPVGVPIFKLMHVDMFYTSQSNPKLVHVASRPGNWAQKFFERRERKFKEMHAKAGGAASPVEGAGVCNSADPTNPLFIMNFLFPGPSNKNMNLVLYYTRRIRPGKELLKKKMAESSGNGAASAAQSRRGSKANISSSGPGSSASPIGSTIDIARVTAFDGLLYEFLDGADEFRDSRLKIIPRIAAGSWIVQKGVGCVPAILGKKVKQWYFRNPEKNYLEVVADVSSSMVAGRILALVKGAATALTIDLSFTIQGDKPEELPESLLGGVRIYHCNLDGLLEIEEHEKWLTDTFLKKEEAEGRW